MPSAVKILYLTRAFSSEAGGMERLSFELVQALRREGVVVQVIAHHGGRVTLLWFFTRCIVLGSFAARRADVIHIGDPVLSFVGYLLRLFTRRPVVVTVHGLDITYPLPLYQWYLRHWFGRFDHYLAISQHVQSLLGERGLAHRSSVIHPGFFDRFYDCVVTRVALDQVLGRPTTGAFVIGTVGRLVTRKGHAWFITHVLPQLPAHTLYVVAGTGPAQAGIQAAAARAGVTGRVLLLGRITDADKRILYNTVDVFVQPNITVPDDVEGFGIVLLEAASSSRLVVAARSGGTADAIIDQENGRMLPPGDAGAWRQVLQQVAATKHLSPLSPTTIRAVTLAHYEWRVIIRQYIKLYRSLAAR